MKDFVLIFRNEAVNESKLTPADIANLMSGWQEWMGNMAAKGQLANPGIRLGFDGKAIKPDNMVTDGPYVELKEILRGFTVVSAENIEDATAIGKGCPILKIGGTVEVRDILPMNA